MVTVLDLLLKDGHRVETEDNKKEQWKLDKHVPLTLILAMVIQTIWVTSWLSTNLTEIRADLKQSGSRIEEIWRDRYTKEDARRDLELSKIRDEEQGKKIEDIDRRLRALEGRR
jgi:hypothetical protein